MCARGIAPARQTQERNGRGHRTARQDHQARSSTLARNECPPNLKQANQNRNGHGKHTRQAHHPIRQRHSGETCAPVVLQRQIRHTSQNRTKRPWPSHCTRTAHQARSGTLVRLGCPRDRNGKTDTRTERPWPSHTAGSPSEKQHTGETCVSTKSKTSKPNRSGRDTQPSRLTKNQARSGTPARLAHPRYRTAKANTPAGTERLCPTHSTAGLPSTQQQHFGETWVHSVLHHQNKHTSHTAGSSPSAQQEHFADKQTCVPTVLHRQSDILLGTDLLRPSHTACSPSVRQHSGARTWAIAVPETSAPKWERPWQTQRAGSIGTTKWHSCKTCVPAGLHRQDRHKNGITVDIAHGRTGGTRPKTGSKTNRLCLTATQPALHQSSSTSKITST